MIALTPPRWHAFPRRGAPLLRLLLPALALLLLPALALLLLPTAPAAGQDSVRDGAVRAMRRAAEYYRERLSVGGGYVYHYSLDLQRRWGEGEASEHQAWVQPPGTPTVGLALLAAYAATNDRYYLDAAREAAEVLAYGQLSSGGWTNQIDLQRRGQPGHRFSGGAKRRDGNSSLDDGQTQSAIRLLVRTDQALGFRHAGIHEAANSALDALLDAQFANGGFPQVWTEPVDKTLPALPASYPDYDWRGEGRIKNYWDMYTLNDNVCGYVAETLIDAHRIYGDERYLRALRRLGRFLLLAQMPDPQRGWAQQYNYRMQPIWARKFEPPGVSGDESQEVLETLLLIHRATGDEALLSPFPSALAYLRRSLLPDGRLARYYELRTNKPLYMVRRSKTVYELTYDDSQLPRHYGWKGESRLDQIEAAYRRRKSGAAEKTDEPVERQQVERLIRQLDEQGRWLTEFTGEPVVGQLKLPIGTRYVSSQTFSDNLTVLSQYVLQTRQ